MMCLFALEHYDSALQCMTRRERDSETVEDRMVAFIIGVLVLPEPRRSAIIFMQQDAKVSEMVPVRV